MCLFERSLKGKSRFYSGLIHAVLLFLIFYAGYSGFAYGRIADKGVEPKKQDGSINSNIVAELNGVPISTHDLIKRYNIFLLISGSPAGTNERLPLNSYLESYITEKLLIQEARSMNITAGRAEVEKEIRKYLEINNLGEDAFKKRLSDLKITREDVAGYFRDNLIVIRLGEKKFGNVKISDDDARKVYDNNYDYFNGPERVSVSHILICHKGSKGCLSDLDRDEAGELARNLLDVATPANFSKLARQYSSDRSADEGGDLGIITRGSLLPAFEDAAFKLEAGKISDVVETERGFHIIFIKAKQNARSQSFELVKGIIKKNLNEEYIASKLFEYSDQLLKTADIKRYTLSEGAPETAGQKKKTEEDKRQKASPVKNFQTFKSTGSPLNVNSKGQPVILFFSRVDCSHCQWISETFNSTVLEYVEKGLIEAHHYDTVTGDDLLTPVEESEIPEKYMDIKKDGSPDYVPYFNFGGVYERRGTGYEAQDDFFAEEMEMRQVIDTLLKQ